jgi:hypothetical protein
MRSHFESEEEDLVREIGAMESREKGIELDRAEMAHCRKADLVGAHGNGHA